MSTSVNAANISRGDLIEWVNSMLGMSYAKVENLCTGTDWKILEDTGLLSVPFFWSRLLFSSLFDQWRYLTFLCSSALSLSAHWRYRCPSLFVSYSLPLAVLLLFFFHFFLVVVVDFKLRESNQEPATAKGLAVRSHKGTGSRSGISQLLSLPSASASALIPTTKTLSHAMSVHPVESPHSRHTVSSISSRPLSFSKLQGI